MASRTGEMGSFIVTDFVDKNIFLIANGGGGYTKTMTELFIKNKYTARIQVIINQLKKVRACPAYRTRHLTKGDTSIGTSCPSAIGFAVEELCEKIRDRCFADEDFGDYDELIVGTEHIDSNITSEEIKEKVNDDVPRCPECGELIIYEGGCNICKACGWSKCD